MKNTQISSAQAQPDGALPVKIKLDGEPREVAAGTTLAQLVASLGHEEAAVSTAVNGEFVPRAARQRVLAEGDGVLLFQPIVGG